MAGHSLLLEKAARLGGTLDISTGRCGPFRLPPRGTSNRMYVNTAEPWDRQNRCGTKDKMLSVGWDRSNTPPFSLPWIAFSLPQSASKARLHKYESTAHVRVSQHMHVTHRQRLRHHWFSHSVSLNLTEALFLSKPTNQERRWTPRGGLLILSDPLTQGKLPIIQAELQLIVSNHSGYLISLTLWLGKLPQPQWKNWSVQL